MPASMLFEFVTVVVQETSTTLLHSTKSRRTRVDEKGSVTTRNSVTYAQHLHLPRHAAASNVALIPSFFDLALPLPEVAQQNMKQGQVQSLAHRIRQSGQPMFSTTSAGDRNARRKLVIDTYMILRDQLINKTVRDTAVRTDAINDFFKD